MKNLIDALVVSIYLFAAAWGGKYTLSHITQKTKIMALEKSFRGLDDLTPMTQKITGRKLNF